MQENILNQILDDMFSEADVGLPHMFSEFASNFDGAAGQEFTDTATVSKHMNTHPEEPQLSDISFIEEMLEVLSSSESSTTSSATPSPQPIPANVLQPTTTAEQDLKPKKVKRSTRSRKIEKPNKLFRRYKGSEIWKEEMFGKLAVMQSTATTPQPSALAKRVHSVICNRSFR